MRSIPPPAAPGRSPRAAPGAAIAGRARPAWRRICAAEPTLSERAAHFARAREADVHHEQPGGGALEQYFLRRRHHGEPALGMAEQVLRGHHDRQVLDGARPDQIAPGRPQFALVGAGRHEDQFGAAQRQRARHLRHVDLAAHGEPDLALLGVEHREVVAGDVLEFPPFAAGIDPRPVRMGAAVARRRAAVGEGHAGQVVRGALVVAERLERAVDRVDAVPAGCFRDSAPSDRRSPACARGRDRFPGSRRNRRLPRPRAR